MTDLHTHRGTAADRRRATERVRTASRVAGFGAVAAAVGLTVALVPHSAAAGNSPYSSTSTDGTSSGGTSTAPSAGDGGGSVSHSGGS